LCIIKYIIAFEQRSHQRDQPTISAKGSPLQKNSSIEFSVIDAIHYNSATKLLLGVTNSKRDVGARPRI
jgi:hypothetical protein